MRERLALLLMALLSLPVLAQQKSQKSFSITVAPALAIGTTALPSGEVGVVYSAQVTAIGGVAPYSFSLLTAAPFGNCGAGPFGSLPGGLTMSNTGVITGTPTAAGSFPICVQVTDSLGAAAQMRYPGARKQSAVSPLTMPSTRRRVGWLHHFTGNVKRTLEYAAAFTIFALVMYAKA